MNFPFNGDFFTLLLNGENIFFSLEDKSLQQKIGVLPWPVQTNHMHPDLQLGYRDFSLYDVLTGRRHRSRSRYRV